MKIQQLIIVLILAFGAMTVTAQTATPAVKGKQINQQKRILQGAKSGEVNKRELVRLERQQRRINRSKKRAKADGKVSGKERAKIHARQNRASRKIRRAKNN